MPSDAEQAARHRLGARFRLGSLRGAHLSFGHLAELTVAGDVADLTQGVGEPLPGLVLRGDVDGEDVCELDVDPIDVAIVLLDEAIGMHARRNVLPVGMTKEALDDPMSGHHPNLPEQLSRCEGADHSVGQLAEDHQSSSEESSLIPFEIVAQLGRVLERIMWHGSFTFLARRSIGERVDRVSANTLALCLKDEKKIGHP